MTKYRIVETTDGKFLTQVQYFKDGKWENISTDESLKAATPFFEKLIAKVKPIEIKTIHLTGEK